MNEWISIVERQPTPNTKILMRGDGDQVEAGYFTAMMPYPWVFFEIGGLENGWPMSSVTHWQPYPKPLKEATDGTM
jgi:hypothetical protein